MRLPFWLAAVLLCSSQGQGQSITVNATDYGQTIDMMGGDMERSSKAIQNAANKAEMIRWSFEDIGFNFCRVQYDKNQELEEGTKNWAFYDKQVATMQQIKAVNPDIRFFATLRSDYDGYGDDNNLPDWLCNYSTKVVDTDKYGIFLADYVEYMSQQGVPVDMMCVAKEWKAYFPADVARDVIIKFNRELTARGVAVPLISDQGFWNLSGCINYIDDVADLGTEDLYGSFSCHDYQDQGLSYWMTVGSKAAALGKPVYNDESSHGGGGPSYGVEPDISSPVNAYRKKCEMYAGGIKGEMMFEIWSRGINRETRAIYCPSGGTGRRMRAYYIMKQFANHVMDSTYVTSDVESMSGVHTMAFRKDDLIFLCVINESTNAYESVPMVLNGTTISKPVIKTCWTSDTDITGAVSSHPASGSGYIASIPAESLNFCIIDLGPAVLALPYAESFEEGLGAWVQSASDNFDWSLGSGYTVTTNTGPSVASDGGQYLYLEGHDTDEYNKTAGIECSFDLGACDWSELSFDYHMFGPYIDCLAVDVSTNGAGWTSNVWKRVGQQHTSSESVWSNAVVDLSAFVGNETVSLRFRGKQKKWHAADTAIDNVIVTGAPFTPFQHWAVNSFSDAPPGTDISSAGNPDGDRLNNLQEWVLVTDPMTADTPPLNISISEPNFILTYDRRSDSGLIVRAGWALSPTSTVWRLNGDGLTEVVIGSGGDVETVAVLIPLDEKQKFIRLEVEQ
ncbi:hypothetical protein P4B35_12125 [Pontiellaceae bacterium B12227]|nr:hypothetical protein [Pontiellaceae bacterium B12227]